MKPFLPLDGIEKVKEYTLGHFEKPEVMGIFNYNFECLFNHVQVRDKLYFFTISKDQRKVTLNQVSIVDGSNKDIVSISFDLNDGQID